MLNISNFFVDFVILFQSKFYNFNNPCGAQKRRVLKFSVEANC